MTNPDTITRVVNRLTPLLGQTAAHDCAMDIIAIVNQQPWELTFANLRKANAARLPLFKDAHGRYAHSSDWTPAQWLQATVGELGEYANIRKKFERGDINEYQFYIEASKELADVMIYLDILAAQISVDLSQAVVAKFNEVSRRVGCEVFL